MIGRALHTLFTPPKINYEIHGNSIPHLHMHIYPRSADDPYAGHPIDWRASFQRSQSDLARIRAAIESQRAAADAQPTLLPSQLAPHE